MRFWILNFQCNCNFHVLSKTWELIKKLWCIIALTLPRQSSRGRVIVQNVIHCSQFRSENVSFQTWSCSSAFYITESAQRPNIAQSQSTSANVRYSYICVPSHSVFSRPVNPCDPLLNVRRISRPRGCPC